MSMNDYQPINRGITNNLVRRLEWIYPLATMYERFVYLVQMAAVAVPV